jgi:hypothetical protein
MPALTVAAFRTAPRSLTGFALDNSARIGDVAGAWFGFEVVGVMVAAVAGAVAVAVVVVGVWVGIERGTVEAAAAVALARVVFVVQAWTVSRPRSTGPYGNSPTGTGELARRARALAGGILVAVVEPASAPLLLRQRSPSGASSSSA